MYFDFKLQCFQNIFENKKKKKTALLVLILAQTQKCSIKLIITRNLSYTRSQSAIHTKNIALRKKNGYIKMFHFQQ